MLVKVLTDEETVILASVDGRVMHFKIDEVNVLSSPGRGVIGIKLDEGDKCLGGGLIGNRLDKVDIETSGGLTKSMGGGLPVVGRGGAGKQEVKRTQFVKIVPSPILLTDWEAIEAGTPGKDAKVKDPSRNGKHGGELFE